MSGAVDLSLGHSVGRPDTISATDFSVIAELVRVRSGIVLGADKAYLVESRLGQIVRSRRFSSLAEIAARLRVCQDEALALDIVEAMTTNETLFFRDKKPFDHLRQHALPHFHAAYPLSQPLRIWSAAASSGQEPYSIAMTTLEAGLGSRSVQILATDISPEQIGRGRSGVYSQFEVRRGLTAEHLTKYFHKEDDSWRIDDRIRKSVEFRRWNLIDDLRPLGTFDVVFCRNVLIYFDLDTKRRVLEAICTRLSPGGLLYLGGSETTLGISDKFLPCPGAHQVYAAVPP